MTAPQYHVRAGAIPPKRAYAGDAGLDIAIQDDYIIQPGETVYAQSGVSFTLPGHLMVQVVTRSSTMKRGIIVNPTIVDSGYTGEISTPMTNVTNQPIMVEKGSFLAQAVLTPWQLFDGEEESLMIRGDNKTGSSGQ